MKRVLLAIVSIGTLFCTGIASATSFSYRITDLGVGYTAWAATSINNLGQVVINDRDGSYLWDETSGLQRIESVISDYEVLGFDVNDNSQVVGGTRNWENAVLWDQTNSSQDIGTLGGSSATAMPINNSGQVAGYSRNNATNYHHAFTWNETEGFVDLGTLGGIYSFARDINDSNQIVGYSRTSNDTPHAFIWDENSGMLDIGTLPNEVQSQANAINETGKVVGYSGPWYGSGTHKSFIWDETNGMQEIAALADDGSSFAFGINDFDVVVGAYNWNQAYIWDATSGMQDLNDLILSPEWLLERATDINNRGQIVGYGSLNGENHAFLLSPVSPVPEPTTMLLFGTGIAGLAGTRLRRKKK